VVRTKQDILKDAAALSTEDRAALAAALLATLEGESEGDVSAAWAVEIERRAASVAEGSATARPWGEVRRNLGRGGA
jgi:putative addiction module component (TIGR02574 family)